MKHLLVFFAFINVSIQSECIVSQWGTWSACYGECNGGLVVRNRDVVRPPLPEINSDGKTTQKLCPHLYETRYCDPSMCRSNETSYYEPTPQQSTTIPTTKANFINRATNLVEIQMKKVGLSVKNEDQKNALRNKFISETEQLFQLEEALNRRYGPSSSDIDSINPTINISTKQISDQQWKNEMAKQWTIRPKNQEILSPQSNNAETSQNTSHVNKMESKSFEIPRTRRLKPTSDKSINALLRRIEQSLDAKKPLDEKYIRNALRRNQKLSKMLVDAYRLKTTLATSTQSTTTVLPSTSADGITTSATMSFWPKTGYIPNTRQHASEITSQLYMTNEIVQKIDEEQEISEVNPDCEYNRRCCKIEKPSCGDGIEPKYVKRWYRPKGASKCIPYSYPRCSSNDEMEELPIIFEQNCQDLCFGKQEKRISPLFTIETED